MQTIYSDYKIYLCLSIALLTTRNYCVNLSFDLIHLFLKSELCFEKFFQLHKLLIVLIFSYI